MIYVFAALWVVFCVGVLTMFAIGPCEETK
jgi:hypothetical protein